MRNFLWRACSNTLPTRDNLHRRKLQVELRCAICHQPRETVCHTLWECPLARNVWALVKGKIQKSVDQASDFLELTRSMLQRLPKEEMERWSVIAWAIWNARTGSAPRTCKLSLKLSFEVQYRSCMNIKNWWPSKGRYRPQGTG